MSTTGDLLCQYVIHDPDTAEMTVLRITQTVGPAGEDLPCYAGGNR